LFSHARDTSNFKADLKGEVCFFGDIAVFAFEAFETKITRLVNSKAISIVTDRIEYARLVKEYIKDAQGTIYKS